MKKLMKPFALIRKSVVVPLRWYRLRATKTGERVRRFVFWQRVRVFAWTHRLSIAEAIVARRKARLRFANAIFNMPGPTGATQQKPAAPGSYFGLPGYTSWTEQKENNDQQVVNLSASVQTPFSAVVPFKTTDVVLWWELEVTWANTMTPGTGTIVTSPYFPYNILGPSKLQIQNQYPALDIQSGIDAALFQMFRPSRKTDLQDWLSASPEAFSPNALPGRLSTASVVGNNGIQSAQDAELASLPVLTFQSSLTPAATAAASIAEQSFNTFTGLLAGDIVLGVTLNGGGVGQAPTANVSAVAARVSAASTLAISFANPTAGALTAVSGIYTVSVLRIGDIPTTASIHFTLEIAGGIYFDDYYELSKDGAMLAQPHRAFVSPTFMASTARSVQPDLRFNPGFATTIDQGPYFQQSAGNSSFASSTVTMGWRRIGVYGANNQAYMPVVYNWQLVRQVKNISLAGVTQKDIPFTWWGQILLVFLRFFDPAISNGGDALPIQSTTAGITKAQLQYGSGLLRFDDTVRTAQRRIIKQHQILPPPGVIVWDLAIDDQFRVTNRRNLNTLTTAGVLAHLEFVAALSSSAYVNVGVEYLAYVE